MFTNSSSSIVHKMNCKLNNNNIYIKREDLLPISFGGNKARKAELFFKEIEEKNFNCVVTYGSSSSNHCRVIANLAAANRIPCYIISPTDVSGITFNKKLMQLFNAKIIQCTTNEVKEKISSTLEELKDYGMNPYFIEGGGHGNIGTLAYLRAYQEILKYEKENSQFFDYIFHASGTGTTQAGLISGQILNKDERNIVGISIAREKARGEKVVLESVNAFLKEMNQEDITKNKIKFLDDYTLDGYGKFNDDILKIIKTVLVEDGIPLDSTYTGKAFWGMREYLKKESVSNKNVLFIHTGGTPLFFDRLEELPYE